MMRIKTTRALATAAGAFVIACVGAVGMPGVAGATDSAVATAAGNCAATVATADTDDLTVDAGAPLGTPGVVDIGLGSSSEGTGGAVDETLVSLPVGDTVDALGVADVSAVSEPLTEGCESVKTTLNSVGEQAQKLLRVSKPAAVEPAPSDDEPSSPSDDSDDSDDSDGDNGTDEPPLADGSVPGNSEDKTTVTYVTTSQAASAQLPEAPLGTLDISALPPAPTDLDLHSRDRASGDGNAGRVDALPAADQAESRTPFLLAIALIAVVAGVLIRSLMARPIR